MGDLAAAIGIAKGGAQVTLLEATHELDEVIVGIQTIETISWLTNRATHSSAKTQSPHRPERNAQNYQLPLVGSSNDQLHAGLVESARQYGVNLLVNRKLSNIDDRGDEVHLSKTTRQSCSFVWQTLFPGVMPKVPSKMAAYRGVLAYKGIFAAVLSASAILRGIMNIFLGPRGLMLTSLVSGGKDCNIGTAFLQDTICKQMEEAEVNEFMGYYKDSSSTVQAVIKMVNYTQCWTLLQMLWMESWSNPQKNIVLLGDGVHCMQNIIAQP